jgi:3-methyladenine DNA glycosylase AlkD
MARPAAAFDARRYFRTDVDLGFLNVGTDAVRAMAKGIVRTHRDLWTVDDALAFAEDLVADRVLEAKALGVEVLACYRRDFSPRLLASWKRWLRAGWSSNWATTDAICGSLIGPLLVATPRLVPRVAAWSRDRNLWVRRASAVALIPGLRRGFALDEAYEVARLLHSDRADLIQKAVGWMLREAGKIDSMRLERYLRANGPTIPRTTVRYAIERFDPAERSRLLKATLGERGSRPSSASHG